MNQVRSVVLVLLAVVLAGCAQQAVGMASLDERVPYSAQEILYEDVVAERVASTNISFFGVRIDDSAESIVMLHGEPDVQESYEFGRVINYEYDFLLDNATAVLYHTNRGVVQAVLVPVDAQQLLGYESAVLGVSRAQMYATLGLPTLTRDLSLERVAHYDSLGYDVYLVAGEVERIYFTTPNRGILPAGRDSDELCAQVLTPARNPSTSECLVFPNPCVVPDTWEVVDACPDAAANTPPVLCVDVAVEARNPETGVCEEFLSTCDVPSSWELC